MPLIFAVLAYIRRNLRYDALLVVQETATVCATPHDWARQLDMVVFPIADGANVVAPGWLIEHQKATGRARICWSLRHTGPSCIGKQNTARTLAVRLMDQRVSLHV